MVVPGARDCRCLDRCECAPMSAAAARVSRLHPVLALAMICFVPLALSFALYYLGWRPGGAANRGELIQPPIRLPRTSLPAADHSTRVDAFGGRWALVYVGPGSCDAACERALLVM